MRQEGHAGRGWPHKDIQAPASLSLSLTHIDRHTQALTPLSLTHTHTHTHTLSHFLPPPPPSHTHPITLGACLVGVRGAHKDYGGVCGYFVPVAAAGLAEEEAQQQQ
jgi:hypothetical protein